jgi:hypothetical protein
MSEDLVVDCPNKKCRARAGKPCKRLEAGVVHIGRWIKRLLARPR